ncbi:MAG: 3',5'-cyclic-nucleotide phosphodiesterase [Chitinophagaceae bacterium]|nr:3',5'-cyclic-nucleotide phosphodiesterase [Chitinophagaceae bacterium]
MKKVNVLILFFLFFITNLSAQQKTFQVVPLGVKGGLDESNLSSYMVAPAGSDKYICLDAGTLYSGIRKAKERGVFHKPVLSVLKENIKGYFISHGHLDHLAGMVINSPDDTSKNIYALPQTIDILKDHYFTWDAWANFADRGEKPTLDKYHYVELSEGKEISADNTEMYITAFPLSHVNPYQSTAFLVRYNDEYLLYLGDTGADPVEKSTKLEELWKYVSPIIKDSKLKALFIEVSFPDSQPDSKLFGHLTPKWLMKEMEVLSSYTGKVALKGLPVVITHIKPSGNNEPVIKKELKKNNPLQLKIIIPVQGKRMIF